jgi:hypothetical protein
MAMGVFGIRLNVNINFILALQPEALAGNTFELTAIALL